ncbi:RNA polymerase sigma factor [Gorillibacterium massiliense]|uniref:RNA polymerase sigma factor n=1 Tax=Gorillibacterium massiliense TaxID=1280390 RepID=UPI0004AE328A|nr:sigma-70 family RNA polymerase sigma factor [Gorillibacterium massiliense]
MSEEVFALLRGDINKLDGETQRQLFIAFRQCVYRDIYYLLADHALTEDVIQEAFFKAVQNGPQTREDSNMTAWIRKLARNASYDMLRKNKKYRHMMSVDSVMLDEQVEYPELPAMSVEEVVEKMIRDETLLNAVSDLKLDYRVVLFLHYIMELTYAEISAELGITEQVLTQRLARARKKLASHFQEKWG